MEARPEPEDLIPDEGHSSGWFLVAEHALPEGWHERAIPVYLISISLSDVKRLQPLDGTAPSFDDDDQAVARLVAEGFLPQQIAARLHLSRRSVFRRLAHLRQLMDCETNAQLATKLAKTDMPGSFLPSPGVTPSASPTYLRRTPQRGAKGDGLDEE